MKGTTSLVLTAAFAALGTSVNALSTSVSSVAAESSASSTKQTLPATSVEFSATEMSPETSPIQSTVEMTPETNPIQSTVEMTPETNPIQSTVEMTPETNPIQSTTEEVTVAGSFTDEQKSIWIERHNYFRVAGLPWAAGNMQRMGWDESLVNDAMVAATSCSASTTIGINVFESTSTDPSTLLEEAINAWVIEPALSNIGSVVPPAAKGDAVGAGLYNSYTQVVWASTTSVGCAMASCTGGSMVACEYSPAGNDGKSAWYVHDAQAAQCPTGTTAAQGLCVVEGDAANELIAPIPDGKWSFQVYPTFVADIMSTIEASGASPPSAGTELIPSPDIEYIPGKIPSDTEQTTIDDTKPSSSPDIEYIPGKIPSDTEQTTIDDTKPSSSPDIEKAVNDAKHTPTDNKQPPSGVEQTPSGTKPYAKDTEATARDDDLTPSGTKKTTSGAKPTPSGTEETASDTKQSEVNSTNAKATSPPAKDLPGKVKPSPENQKTSLSSETATTTTTTTKQNDDAMKKEPSKQTPPKESGSGSAVSASNESGVTKSSGSSISPEGIAGMIVVAVVIVAALAVFMSYRKNQQRQRDIMRDGNYATEELGKKVVS